MKQNIPCILYIIKTKNDINKIYQEENLDWAISSLKYNANRYKDNQFHIITNYDFKNIFITFKNIFLHDYQNYVNENMKIFDKNYIHLSTNYYYFEKNCILGYMMLNEFCKKNKIEFFLHLETDILLFTDSINEDFDFFSKQNYCLTLLRQKSAGGCFFNLLKYNMLQKFSDYVVSTYSLNINQKPKCFDLEKQKKYYQESIDKKLMRGGVSDMHFWNFIYETNKNIIFGNMELPINNIIYHQTLIDKYDNILIKNKILFNNIEQESIKLEINNNECYAFKKENNQPIKIKMLHFHGDWKQKIKEFCKYE